MREQNKEKKALKNGEADLGPVMERYADADLASTTNR
jgi:hypothetical protein